jgi:glycosyltransferase involved in cell wall biosynthesis
VREYNLLKRIAARHSVDLVAFNQTALMDSLFTDRATGLEECRRELSQWCRQLVVMPIERLERPFGKARTAAECLLGGDGYTADWLRSAAAAAAIRGLAQRETYAAAYFNVISLARYQPLVAAPAVLGHQNIESHMMRRRAENEPNILKRIYFRQEARRLRRYERTWAPRFAANIVCSDLDGARLREVVPGVASTTIPNGVDCGYFRPLGRAERPDSLIFVGSLNWYPNTDAVLFLLREIWPRLKAVRPAVTLDIVGARPPRAILTAAAMLPGVTVHGLVNDVRPLIETAAVYVCPIRDGGGTKLKILDACAMRKCIVAHPIACEGIDLTAGVDVRMARTAGDFVQSIVDLLGDEVARGAMGRAARALAESRYSFDAIGERMADLLEGVAGAGAVQPGCNWS